MRTVILALAVLGALACLGCRTKQEARLLYPPVPGRMPSLVFESPAIADLRPQDPGPGDADLYPWYADRLERGPVAFRGYDTPQFSAQAVYTWDQQIATDGRVHDHFRRTNRHLQIQQQVR